MRYAAVSMEKVAISSDDHFLRFLKKWFVARRHSGAGEILILRLIPGPTVRPINGKETNRWKSA
jgi:hypothetical protein